MALNKWDKQHLLNLGLTQKQIDRIFETAVKEAAAIGVSLDDVNPDKPFSFADYPETKARIDKIIKDLQKRIETAIVNGVRSEWTLANNKNNVLCDFVFGDNKYKLTKAKERKYYNNNDKALEAFMQRKTAGLNLSDRVWNYTDQFKTEIEMGLDLGIRDGLPAAEMARDLKQYLKEPNRLFRRVRYEHGQLRLSQAAKNYNPGAGVYRSSYKNAMRLARTEVNMSYRTADHERWQQLDFVVGIEICLSNNHTLNGRAFTDICDTLAGKYPKDFKFTGWHPQCRCHAISILKTQEELTADTQKILNGEDTDNESDNKVEDVPENFKSWVKDNQDRIEKANNRGTLPYFLKDNATFAGISVNKINVTGRTELLKAALQKYNSYGSEWEKAYFDEFNGGFNVYHKEHQFATTGGGGAAEKNVGKMLAKYNGKQVEFLPEGSNMSADVKFEGKTWEIKYINNSNIKTIRNYIELTRRKGADNGIFYWDNEERIDLLRAAIQSETGKMFKLGRIDEMPDIYYIDKSGLLKLLWKK